MPVFGRILFTAETENLLEFLSTRKKSGFAIDKQQSAVRPSGPLTQTALHTGEELAIIKKQGIPELPYYDGQTNGRAKLEGTTAKK